MVGIFYSCDLLNLGDDNKITGSTDPSETLGVVGNWWKAKATGYSDATLLVTDNKDGLVTASLSYNGKTFEYQATVTTDGIFDYVYSNGDTKKPFTLVRFDAKVGDKWEYKVGSKKVVREVVRKSTEDDVQYGFFLVKTIDVEETIPEGVEVRGGVAPVKKVLYKFNHKFGFIAATLTKTDGTAVELK